MEERLIDEIKTCPVCKQDAPMRDWLPPPGIDPRMRLYRCVKCKEEFFQVARFRRSLENGQVPIY